MGAISESVKRKKKKISAVSEKNNIKIVVLVVHGITSHAKSSQNQRCAPNNRGENESVHPVNVQNGVMKGSGMGIGSLFLVGVPVQAAAGAVTPVASHGFGYEQPFTAVIPFTVS
jgi:hypothetical protein